VTCGAHLVLTNEPICVMEVAGALRYTLGINKWTTMMLQACMILDAAISKSL